MSMLGRAFGRAYKFAGDVASGVGNFLRRHWAATAAIVLGLIAFAVVMSLIVFAWPGLIGAAAGLTIVTATGTFTPLAFLTSLSVPAAAAVLGSFAFAATIVASAVLNAFVGIYNWINTKLTKNLPENRIQGDHVLMGELQIEDGKMISLYEKLPRPQVAPRVQNFQNAQEAKQFNEFKNFGNYLHDRDDFEEYKQFKHQQQQRQQQQQLQQQRQSQQFQGNQQHSTTQLPLPNQSPFRGQPQHGSNLNDANSFFAHPNSNNLLDPSLFANNNNAADPLDFEMTNLNGSGNFGIQ